MRLCRVTAEAVYEAEDDVSVCHGLHVLILLLPVDWRVRFDCLVEHNLSTGSI